MEGLEEARRKAVSPCFLFGFSCMVAWSFYLVVLLRRSRSLKTKRSGLVEMQRLPAKAVANCDNLEHKRR